MYHILMYRRNMRSIVLIVGLFSVLETGIYAKSERKCSPDDWQYVYTECDSNNERWRVAVPNLDKCDSGDPPPPTKGKGCEFTCAEGEYLDIQKLQDCIQCPAGTYSLGGGVRFEDWDTIPDGFTTKAESFKMPEFGQHLFHFHLADAADNNCTSLGWVAKRDMIVSSPTNCAATLVYSAHLVKRGQVKFEYAYSDDNAIFHFVVQNDQCQTVGDHNANSWPPSTEAGEWKSITVPLTPGLNLLQWKTIGIGNQNHMKKPVMIRKIEILGVAFTSECTKCKEGTYSSSGAKACTPCDANFYSGKGAGQCLPCDSDKYALKGSATCSPRVACTVDDYYEYTNGCDENGNTEVMYKWIEPQVCREDLPDAVHLPTSGSVQACPPCNPGMEFINGSCHFCTHNQYSDGNSPCMQCPPSMAPEYALEINWWNNLPEEANISSSCLTMNGEGCSSKEGWVKSVDHMQSRKGNADDAYLVLSLDIGGFNGVEQVVESTPVTIATVTFQFELQCTDDCSFYFMKQSESKGTQVIETFEKSQSKQRYSYAIKHTEAVTLSWAFQKKGWGDEKAHAQTYNLKNDVAIIYSIEVTNTKQGGARGCKACPQGTTQAGCIPCPPGQYIDNMDQCVTCPGNTIAHGSSQQGIHSCRPCGSGLIESDHTHCVTDCRYTSPEGRHYDFTKIGGLNTVSGNPLFTTSGTQYYHHFNISLCGEPMVQCADNISFTGNAEDMEKVTSMICRSTLIPPKPGEQEGVLSAQPLALGDVLVSITGNSSVEHANISANMYAAGFPDDDTDLDVHFTYLSEVETTACKKGRTTVITLRCDPQQKGNGLLMLPPKCLDGTCDGCNFYFLWKTALACPKCSKADYTVFNGECILGKQEIRYQPPKYCVGLEAYSQKQACTILPFWMMVAGGAVTGFGLLLFVLVLYCWKKNRKLEYKYSKLMMGSNKDGELPEVETCALDDGEDDEQFDAVHFKESKGKRLFNKFKSLSNRRDIDEFEPIRMDKVPLT